MAWTSSTAEGRLVRSESVTLANAGDAYSTVFSVDRDEDFTIFINTGALNTVGAVTTGLQVSWDGTTFVTLIAAGTIATDCDTAVKVKAYVAGTSGDFPYYRLLFTCAANDSANAIVCKIVN
jgi:hypothetical protein